MISPFYINEENSNTENKNRNKIPKCMILRLNSKFFIMIFSDWLTHDLLSKDGKGLQTICESGTEVATYYTMGDGDSCTKNVS